jgi:hypothetical protein
MVVFCVIALPIAVVIATAILWYYGLSKPSEIDWGLLTLGSSLHVILCVAFAIFSFTDSAGGVIAFLLAMAASLAALVASLILAATLNGNRKFAAGVMAVLFPVTLFLSSTRGIGSSPEKRNGQVVVEALEAYHAENGAYPQWLHELMPTYLADLKEPSTIWGWLYFPDVNADEFTLAYVTRVGQWVLYSFDAYRSNTGEWEHLMWPEGGPEFILPETPMSDRPIPSAMPTIFAYQSQIAPTVSAWQTHSARTPTVNPRATPD